MTDPTIFLGQTLGDYEVLASRGEGAFSLVYKARHIPSDTEVAVKILKPSATVEQIREFDNEGELLVKLSGATRVVNILDSQVASLNVVLSGTTTPISIAVRFHVLELAAGCLDELVAHLDQVPWAERLGLFRDVVLGVHQMHCQSLMHRDLKSSNCLLFDISFRSVLAKVTDLGRARDLKHAAMASALHYRIGRGDPNFWPPEMFWELGRDDPNIHRCADLYGLGCVFFELITGQGITALVLFPKAPLIQSDLALPDDARRRQYAGRADEIRSWYETAYSFAGAGVPPAIRLHTLALLRQLCDPTPGHRLPTVAPGRRLLLSEDLSWLLRKVDILIKTLRNSELQRDKLLKKKAT